jgi:repressor LexA
MTLGEKIRKARINKGLTQSRLAQILGISNSTLNKYENNTLRPNVYILEKIAKVLDIPIQYFFENETPNFSNVKEVEMVILPILGNIRAGQPLFAEEHLQGYMPFPKEMLSVGYEHFLLRAEGNSMIGDGIEDGDVVLIRVQNYVDYNGQIVAVIIDGNETCLKHLYHPENSDMVILRSSNPAYSDIVHPANDIIINGVYMGVFKKPKK